MRYGLTEEQEILQKTAKNTVLPHRAFSVIFFMKNLLYRQVFIPLPFLKSWYFNIT